MRAVVDTNVVVSAILRDRAPEKVLLHLIENAACEWVASDEILAEYREVLRRPRFGLPPEILLRWDERFRQSIALWPVTTPTSRSSPSNRTRKTKSAAHTSGFPWRNSLRPLPRPRERKPKNRRWG